MLKISSSGTSNAGKKKINEDNFYMNGIFIAENNAASGRIYSDNTQRSMQFYAVFDGIGDDISSDINPNINFQGGENAAFAGADMLARLQRHLKTKEKYNINDYVNRFAKKTNKNICDYMRQKELRTGASFALLCLGGNSAYVYNIGNSKVFLLRDNRIILISQNDTKAESLVLAKQISADIVRHTPDNKILTQYLGMFEHEKQPELHMNRLNLRNGDKFLICSDGLEDYLTNERIYQIMARDISEQEIITDLINESMRSPDGKDNLTAIVVGVNYSDGAESKVNLLRPTSDVPTHFNPIVYRNKFSLKPKHIRQIILAAGFLIICIVAITLLFNGPLKQLNSDGDSETSENTESSTDEQDETDEPGLPGVTGNIVVTTEDITFDIPPIDENYTEETTTEEATTYPTTAPATVPPATSPATAAPVTQSTTAAPTAAPPPTNPPAATAEPTAPPSTAEVTAPVETTTEEEVTEPPTEQPTPEQTQTNEEPATEPPATEPTEPATEPPVTAEPTTEAATAPETFPPPPVEETIAAE